MERAILAVGMRGAGKTTYCKRVKAQHPDIHLVSRDEYFTQNFGNCYFDPYSGISGWAYELFWQHIKDVASQYKGTLIIDSWTGYVAEREGCIRRLRKMGVSRVDCWYFDVELSTYIKRFVQREYNLGKGMESEESLARRCVHDYKLFRENISDILVQPEVPTYEDKRLDDPYWIKDTFDEITTIVVEQLVMPGMPLI